MKVITEKEYLKKPESSTGIWDTERTDLLGWEVIRSQYMGKRTMLDYDKKYGTVLLIEGLNLTITKEGE